MVVQPIADMYIHQVIGRNKPYCSTNGSGYRVLGIGKTLCRITVQGWQFPPPTGQTRAIAADPGRGTIYMDALNGDKLCTRPMIGRLHILLNDSEAPWTSSPTGRSTGLKRSGMKYLTWSRSIWTG